MKTARREKRNRTVKLLEQEKERKELVQADVTLTGKVYAEYRSYTKEERKRICWKAER